MSVKLLKQVASVVTLVTFIATNSVYASSDSKSIFKNKKVDYQKISNQTENVIQKKKAILSGEDAKQSESQQKEAQRILSSHLSDIALIHLPPELGRIVEVHQGEGSRVKGEENEKLIIHIQDLHTNPEAEYNLAKILELLLNDYKMGLVCSEGAVGSLDTKEIASFPDYAAREKVGKIFVNAGELTGEEYLAITKYPDIPIWGIEAEDIYFKNIIDFNKIMKFNSGSQIFISQAKKALEELKVKIYTKELLDLDQKEADYKAQKLEIADYISYLTNYINKLSISSDSYKNISLLTETMSKEKTIDQLRVMNESQNVLLSLQSSLAAKSLRSDSDSLMANAQLFKDQKISPFSFYSYLKSLANKHLKDDFAAKYPNLNSFTEYLAKVNSIDSTDLFLEFENLSFEIKEAISKTEEQKTLVKALRNINFLEGFFNLKVSNEELDYYLSNKDSHKVAFFEAFLKPILKKYNISAFIDYNPSLIDPHLIELEEFYKVVKERDLAMVNNSLSEIEKRNSKVSTLIAGGFHTKGITRLLKERGYSYIVVSPYSKTDMNEENYHFLLSGQRKPITELLNQLDVKEIFNRFMPVAPGLRVPLASNTTLIKSWNTKHITEIANATGISGNLLRLEPIIVRAGITLGLLKRAEDWPGLPFSFIKVKVLQGGQRVVFHFQDKDGQDAYFKGYINDENKKPTLSTAAISDFNQAGILKAAITPSLNLIDVQKSIAIAPAIALASNQEMSANEKIEKAFVFYKAAYRNTGQMDAEGMPADPEALKAILGRPYKLVAEALLSGSDISDENLDNAITILKDAKGLLYVSDKVKYDAAERIFNIATQRRAAAAPDRFLRKRDRIEEINGAVEMASNKGLQAEIKSLVPEIGTSEARERLRKILTDLKNSSNLEGLSILKAELETNKRALGYAMDTDSGGMAYVFTLTDSFLKEVVSAILQEGVKGNKDAYLAIKNMNPLEAIAHFESGLENTIANLPEDLFGHGFGYDIRGNALKIDGGIIDMTPENLYAIGKLLALKYTKPGDKYLVAGDIRMHTPILRYAMVLGAASVGADVDFSEEELSSGAHNVYSAENPEGYKVQVQMSGSHGVFQKNGAKIKADIGNNRLDPVYGEELAKLYNDRQQILAGAKTRNAQTVKIKEVSGIEDAIIDMYDKTLPKTVKDEILILDTRAGGGGSLAAKLLAKQEYEVIDVDEVFGILGQAADMRALLSDQDNVARLLSLLNEKWDGGKHKIVFMLNMHPDPLMRRGIWDPSKPEAMVPTVTLVKAINGNLREGMPQAIGGVYDGDADRIGAVKENGEDIPAFEMTIPYYQRFLLDPQNKAAIIQMANAGIEPLWLALDVRANSKLQNTLAKISGILKDEYEKQYKKEYSGDMLNFVYINTGYPPQLAFIAWRIEEMKKLVDSTPTLRDDPRFMENFNHLIHTYYTAEASGHNFFHVSPGNTERPCDCAIAAFISLINIKETMDVIEAPVLGIPKGSKTPLVTLFETFPPTITSNEIWVVIPNSVKIATAHELGKWLEAQYRSELLSHKADKIKIGDLEYEPAENGLVTVAGYKAQLKSGDSILIRWSNTGEQLTLLFEGHTINSLIANVETVLEKMKEMQQDVPGLKLDDLEKELAGLKQKRDSTQLLASNNELTQADIQRMIEGKAVPAAKVIEDKRGFKNWVDRQSNITVTIVAMTGEEYAAVNDLHGFNNGQVIVITVERAEELRAKFTEDFAIYDQNIFGSFDLNNLSVARKAVYNRELEKARTSGV